MQKQQRWTTQVKQDTQDVIALCLEQARVSLSCGPFAATPMSVNDLARMTSACYQATYCSFIERIKALFALVSSTQAFAPPPLTSRC